MKIVKLGAVVLSVTASVVALVGCSGKSNSATASTQTATVQRGNILVSTTSTGNLAFTQTEDVAFDMAGTVEQVNVEVGDSVTEGQILATLDTSARDDQISKLEQAITAAQNTLSDKERQIVTAQFGVRQAELNLQSAENSVANIPAVKNAQQLVDLAQAALTNAQGALAAGQPVSGDTLAAIQQQLAQAKSNLQSVLAGTSFSMSSDVSLQIAKAELSLDQSEQALDDANQAVVDANTARDNAAQSVQDAQTALQEAKALSPEVTAPFDGIVTKVNVQGGQDINKGAVAVTIADPNKFEVGVLVGERDIASMAIGGLATVSVDSMTGITLPATITAIAPTATIQQGVVNYQVTVEVGSLPSRTSQSTSDNSTTGSYSTGQFPGGRTPSGGQFPGASSGNQTTGRNFGGSFASGGGLFASTQSATLRQGLSVTVNLVTASKSNVLMVPNRAISKQQGKSYVTVEKNGTTEQVSVTTGISNSQYTEITDGVVEGDTVIIPITTSTTSSTTQQRGGAFFPGGGILR